MGTTMSVVERRRSARVAIVQEEAAVIHARDIDLPVRIIDLSKTGALVHFLYMPSFGSAEFAAGEPLQLSVRHSHSVCQIMARVIRTTHEFIAVEFLDQPNSIWETLEEK